MDLQLASQAIPTSNIDCLQYANTEGGMPGKSYQWCWVDRWYTHGRWCPTVIFPVSHWPILGVINNSIFTALQNFWIPTLSSYLIGHCPSCVYHLSTQHYHMWPDLPGPSSPPCLYILQGTKCWRWEWPGNLANLQWYRPLYSWSYRVTCGQNLGRLLLSAVSTDKAPQRACKGLFFMAVCMGHNCGCTSGSTSSVL